MVALTISAIVKHASAATSHSEAFMHRPGPFRAATTAAIATAATPSTAKISTP